MQAQADARREFVRQQRRHRLAWALWAVAGIIFVTHFFMHAGTIQLMAPSLQDLFLGWPTAILVALVGGVVYGT